MSIIDPVLWQCRRRPEMQAIVMPGQPHHVTTYGELGRMVQNVARRARQLGLRRGDTVVLVVENHAIHMALIIGLAEAGIVTISARSPGLPKTLKAAAYIADFSLATPPGETVIPVDFSWTFGDGTPLSAPRPRPTGEELVRIVLTSGTTGEPKAVGFTQRMIADRMLRLNYVYGPDFPMCTRTHVDFGFGTFLGFQIPLYTLTRGGTVFFPGDTYANMFNAFDLHRAQCWFGSPAGLAKLVEHAEGASAPQITFDMMYAGGSLFGSTLVERTRTRLCKNLVVAYGSTEANHAAAGPASELAHIPGAVGYVSPETIVEAVDANGALLPHGKEGLLRIAGRYTIAGYLNDPEESAKVFRDGWFYPGDLGMVTENDVLVISGRQKNVINVGGDKASPERIEAVLLSVDGIADAGVVTRIDGLGLEEVWAVLVVQGDRNDDQLLQACRARLPETLAPRRIVRVPELPKDRMGRLDRQQLAELVEPD